MAEQGCSLILHLLSFRPESRKGNDHSTGMLTLKTTEGDLELHFPLATVQKLKEGDTITVHLSYSQSTAAH
jgi:hypothetical protein